MPSTIAEVIPAGTSFPSTPRTTKYPHAVDGNTHTHTHDVLVREAGKHTLLSLRSANGPAPNSHLEVEAGGGPRHQGVEVLVEILTEDVLGHGLIGVEGLLLS